MKLTHIRLLVDDIEACRSFYKEKLAFKEQTGGGRGNLL